MNFSKLFQELHTLQVQRSALSKKLGFDETHIVFSPPQVRRIEKYLFPPRITSKQFFKINLG